MSSFLFLFPEGTFRGPGKAFSISTAQTLSLEQNRPHAHQPPGRKRTPLPPPPPAPAPAAATSRTCRRGGGAWHFHCCCGRCSTSSRGFAVRGADRFPEVRRAFWVSPPAATVPSPRPSPCVLTAVCENNWQLIFYSLRNVFKRHQLKGKDLALRCPPASPPCVFQRLLKGQRYFKVRPGSGWTATRRQHSLRYVPLVLK